MKARKEFASIKPQAISNTNLRVEALDYLRGLLALSVMLYHYKGGSNLGLGYPLEQIFQRVGVYAVCTFFVLSGMSLSIVYGAREVNRAFLWEFAVKRFFRIAPLFWLVITLTIALRWFIIPALDPESNGLPRYAMMRVMMNYSLSFGFLRADFSLPTGGWSIGNEVVFYSLFPGLLLLMRSSQTRALATFIATLSLGMLFGFELLHSKPEIGDDQWPAYVNPLNHLFLFAGGVALPIYSKRHHNLRKGPLIVSLFVCLGFFCLWPTEGRGEAVLWTGWDRLVFSSISFAFCYIALKWPTELGHFTGFSDILAWVGNISYAVYLLHPLVGDILAILNLRFLQWNAAIVYFLVAAPTTVLCSMISWRYVEKPIMRLGRTVLH